MKLRLEISWLWVFLAFSGYLALVSAGILLGNPLLQGISMALPLAGIGLYVYFFHFPKFVWLMVGIMPLSLNILDVGGGLGLSIPAEMMMLGVAIAVLFKNAKAPFIDARVWKHPITVAILINLAWLGVTSITSTYSIISLKFMVMRIMYLWVFFFFFQHLFSKSKNITRFLWLYTLPLVFVIGHAFRKHIGYGLDQIHSHEISMPFFPDHTIYGAALAFLIPFVLVAWSRRKEMTWLNRPGWLLFTVAAIFLAAVFFSFSRAAWLSLIIAGIMYLLLRFRIPFRLFVGGLLVLFAVAWGMRDTIYMQLKSTKQVSSGDVLEHAGSVSNIETDPSNKERVNRWSCAIRMFEERPFWGFGPGTFQFNYGVYQVNSEMTRISTKRGDRGDVHSEYFKALTESGIFGLATWLVLILAIFHTGMRVVYTARTPRIKYLGMATLLGLTTYFAHGLVNNFLYTDKMASLFWAMCAMVLALDIYHRQEGSLSPHEVSTLPKNFLTSDPDSEPLPPKFDSIT